MLIERTVTFQHPSTLARIGANPLTERNKLPDYVAKNLASYELHIIKNHVVSLPYSYYIGRYGELYSDPDQNSKSLLNLDPYERDGYYSDGIYKAVDLAKNHQDQVVALYSPPGPASFQLIPPEDYSKPYTIGQLYLMWFDGQKINNIAVSINGQGEQWLEELMGRPFINRHLSHQEIIDDITHPYLTEHTLETLLTYPWSFQDYLFQIKNLDGAKKYSLPIVLNEIRKSIDGQLATEINHQLLAEQFSRDGGSLGFDPYQEMLKMMMQSRGITKAPLGGGCSGEIEILGSQLGIDVLTEYSKHLSSKPNLSSDYRKSLQSETKEKTYPCQMCGKPIPYEQGDNIKDQKKWRKFCPHCHSSLDGQCK